MSKYCRSCGYCNTDQAKFCGKCGKPITSDERQIANDVVAAQNKGTVKPVNKWLMLPLSILIGTAMLVFFAWFIEFDYSNIAVYANDVRKEIINSFHIDPSSKWIDIIAQGIIWIAIYGVASTAYMLPLRFTRVLRKTMDKGEWIVVALMGLIVFAIGGLLCFLIKYFLIDQRITQLLINIPNFNKMEWVHLIIGVLVTLMVLAFLLVVFFTCIAGIGSEFMKSIKVNGIIGGTFSALYDCFTSLLIFVAAALVVCYGVVVIGGLLLVLMACSSGGRRVVEVDGEYYYVD